MNDNYNLVWNLFKTTGEIKYFLLAKKIKESEKDENSRCEGTSSK